MVHGLVELYLEIQSIVGIARQYQLWDNPLDQEHLNNLKEHIVVHLQHTTGLKNKLNMLQWILQRSIILCKCLKDLLIIDLMIGQIF